MIQVFRIDSNGFFVEPVVINDTDPMPSDCVAIIPSEGLYKPQLVNGNWVEGEDPGVLLAVMKAKKDNELNDKCNQAILYRFGASYNGTTYYFSHDSQAQGNFELADKSFDKGRTTSVTWTAYDSLDGNNYYRLDLNQSDFVTIYMAHAQVMPYNVSKYRDVLLPKLNATTTVDEVNLIFWYEEGTVSVSSSSDVTVIVS